MAASPAAAYYLSFLLLTTVFSVCCSAQYLNRTFCKTQSLPKNWTFHTCIDLPTLGATLHWTYESVTGNLNLAYTASNPDGWVAWGINPTGVGMLGTQALVAVSESPSMVMTPYTYNISGYTSVVPGPISFDVSNLTTMVEDNVTMIFATMMLPPGTRTVNTVWQVGPMMNGTSSILVHSMGPQNLGSVFKLGLINDVSTGGSPSPSPAPSVGPSPMSM